MFVLALGLPLAWNMVVKDKWAEWRAAQVDKVPESVLLAEEAALQILVDERRVERGLQPVYSTMLDASAHALFEQVKAMESKRRTDSAANLARGVASGGSGSSGSSSLPVFGLDQVTQKASIFDAAPTLENGAGTAKETKEKCDC